MLAAAALFLAACAAPAHGSADYAAKAAQTAKAAASDVATALVAARLGGQGRAWRPYVDVVLSNAEDDLSSVIDTFDSVQPPTPADDRLRERLDGVLQKADSVVSDLRIEVRRSGGGALPSLARQLDPVARELQQLAAPAS